MPVSRRKTYSMTDTLPDVNLDPPDDITGEYEDNIDENGNVIELDDDERPEAEEDDRCEDDKHDEYSPDDLDDYYDGFENNETFGGRNYP